MVLADLAASLCMQLHGQETGLDAALGRVDASQTTAAEQVDRHYDLDLEVLTAAQLQSWIETVWMMPDRSEAGEYLPVLVRMIQALQLIDQWYAPLATAVQDRRAALREDHILGIVHLSNYHRLNPDAALGTLILRQPRWGVHTQAEPYPELMEQDCCHHPNGVNALFTNLLYLPPTIDSGDPDREDGDHPAPHNIALAYRLVDRRLLPPMPALDKDIIIGVAPIAERADDVGVTYADSLYHVYPAALDARIRTVLTRLIRDHRAHLVLLPEMTVRGDTMRELRVFIQQTAVDTPFVMALIGVADPPSPASAYSRNRVVLIGADGSVLHEQDKMIRWNLDCRQRDRFGLDGSAVAPDARLMEGIKPGTTLTILEIRDLGRVMALICADMSRLQPAGWLRRNVLLDWTFAPIMDATCHLDETRRPWISAAAYTAARLARSRAVVVNSMTLTRLQNEQNRRSGATDRITEQCGVALLMDGRESPIRARRVSLSLESPADCAAAEPWQPEGWHDRLSAWDDAEHYCRTNCPWWRSRAAPSGP